MFRLFMGSEGNLSIDIRFHEKLDLSLVRNDYLLLNLKNSKVCLRRNGLYCDGCGVYMMGERRYFAFKGIFFCEECLKKIKDGEIGVVMY